MTLILPNSGGGLFLLEISGPGVAWPLRFMDYLYGRSSRDVARGG